MRLLIRPKTVTVLLCASLLLLIVAFNSTTEAAPTMLDEITLTLKVDTNSSERITDITHAGDGRIFFTEQSGDVRVIDASGALLATPFFSTPALDNANEAGLLGIAFHPDYATNGHVYVHYTRNVSGQFSSVIARYTAADPSANTAGATETIILTVAQPFGNHNSGPLNFGPDGYLYISMGDGGSGDDPGDRSQNGNLLLGKMLRIDVDGGSPYAIPASNPYAAAGDGVLDEIWAIGLRNPWRFAFDSQTGDMWLADVGQSAWEEINFQAAGDSGGHNYGWRCRQGANNHITSGLNCSTATFTDPIHQYTYGGSPFRCAIVGGDVYRGATSTMDGIYFFADYCSKQIWAISGGGANPTVTELTVNGAPSSNPISFGVDNDGELYVGFTDGTIYEISDPNYVPTAVTMQAADTEANINSGWLIAAVILLATLNVAVYQRRHTN